MSKERNARKFIYNVVFPLVSSFQDEDIDGVDLKTLLKQQPNAPHPEQLLTYIIEQDLLNWSSAPKEYDLQMATTVAHLIRSQFSHE